MTGFVVRRLLAVIPLLFIVSFVAWALILLVPGDPAVTLAGEGASLETIAAIRKDLGLDQPIPVQYAAWLGRTVQGDLGKSLFSGVEVVELVKQRLPVTISLTAYAILLAVLIAAPLGSLAAFRAGSRLDRFVTIFATSGIALPSFWFAGLLLIVFVVWLRLFPGTGFVPLTTDPAKWALSLTLPAVAASVSVGAQLMRQVRAALIGVLQEDYIRTARSKGLGGLHILVRHAFRNAAPPVITVLGLRIAGLLEGAVIIESLFALPGIGSLVVQSAFNHDLYVIQGVTIMFTILVLVINLFVDVCYAWLNPRVRLA